MLLFTGRYRLHKPEHGLCVRTTVGGFRNRPKYPIDETFSLATPLPALVKAAHTGQVDEHQFEESYVAMLNGHGTSAIGSALALIAARHGVDRLVLCCFDDLTDSWCHRTMFGRWWADVTGETVEELAPPRPPKKATAAADSLFEVSGD